MKTIYVMSNYDTFYIYPAKGGLKMGGKLFFFLHRGQLGLYVPPEILWQSKRAAAAQVWKNKLHWRSIPLISASTLFLESIILYQFMSIKNNFIKDLNTVHVIQNCQQNKSMIWKSAKDAYSKFEEVINSTLLTRNLQLLRLYLYLLSDFL